MPRMNFPRMVRMNADQGGQRGTQAAAGGGRAPLFLAHDGRAGALARLGGVLFVLLTLAGGLHAAGLSVTGLRVGGQVTPLGLDEDRPGLSWRVESPERGARQTAYRVLVASSADLLARGHGDLWDTGRVESVDNLRLVYAGASLASSQTVFWKVQAWDERGQTSAWSEAATWTSGVLAESDWSPGTRWISDAELLRWQRAKLGYRSKPSKDATTRKWLLVDLGQSVPIEAVRLRAVAHTVDENLGFPRRYQVEVASRSDFSDARIVASTEKETNPWIGLIDLPLKEVTARFLRFTATQLRVFHGEACLAVSQIEVLSNGRNVAPSAEITASDTLENAQWSLAAINDGLGVPGANPRASDTLLLRRGFTVKFGLKRALLHLSGLGHATLALNGEKVKTDRLLTPGWTDYRKTCLYDTHDLTAHLREGENVLGLTLAGGMYNVQTGFKRYVKFVSAYRPLMAFGELRLEYADGTSEVVSTDESWQVAAGPTTYANIFGGEDYDARRDGSGDKLNGGNDQTVSAVTSVVGASLLATPRTPSRERARSHRAEMTEWKPAVATNGPGGVLRGAAWAAPALVAHEALEPVSVKAIKPGVSVYDFGQNAAIMPRLRVRGPAGATVRMIPAELVKPDGAVSRGSVGGGSAYWQYTLKGDPAGETWMPDFFYHGARYLQVELSCDPAVENVGRGRRTPPSLDKPTGYGDPALQSGAENVSKENLGAELPLVEKLESVVVHSDSPAAGTFACSNELFNRIHTLVRWAQRSNMVSVLSDCPHRERLGWLEQYHLNGPALRYEWDIAQLFAKGFNDMADAQRPNGLVPSIAPEYVVFDGGFVDSPEWGSALILAAWQHYQFTGDDAPLRRHYGAMQRYFNYLTSRADKHIVSHGLGDWYDIGPKGPGVAQLTPIALTATAIYYEDARALAQIADFIGKTEDARRYTALAAEIGAAFHAKFFNAATDVYATGSQTAQAMPLVLGLVSADRRDAVLDGLLKAVVEHGHGVTAGDVGYRYLLRALADTGHSDVIFAMNNQSEKPGYGYQLAQGATALTEAWNTNRNSSQNHFMLGQINEWFYQDLAGLSVDPVVPGFKNVIIRPQPVGDLTWAEATHRSPYGEIKVRWERLAGKFVLRITVPANSTATVFMPVKEGGTVREGGQPATQAKGVKFLRREGEREVFAVESGSYAFEAVW